MPLVWIALGLALGLLLSVQWTPPLGATVLLMASLATAHLLMRSLGLRLGLPILLAFGVLLGLARGGPDLLEAPGQLRLHHDEQVQILGVTTSLPELVVGRIRLNLSVREIKSTGGAWQAAQGALLVWAQPQVDPIPGRSYPYLDYGDQLVLEGRMEVPIPFSGFDYPRYLASQGIGSLMSGARVVEVSASVDGKWWLRQVQHVRRSLAASLARVLPEPQAALSQALLVGRRGSLPSDVSDSFQQSGIAYLLALSGLHVGVVLATAMVVSRALLGRRRNLYLVGPLLLMWAYALLAGAFPSIVQASLIGTIYLLAMATGRGTSPLNALAAAAMLMLAWEPRWLWHISFHLSFAAMASVLLIGLPSWNRLRQSTWVRGGQGSRARPPRVGGLTWVLGGLLISGAAVLGTLPLVAFNFQQVPLLGIPATLLVLPALPGLVVGGFAAAVLGLVWTPLGWLAAWIPLLLGGYVLLIVESIPDLSWSVVNVPGSGGHLVWAYYVALIGAMSVPYRHRWVPPALGIIKGLWAGPQQPVQRVMVLVVLVPFALAPWVAGMTRSDGLAHFYFLDVGQGDATLVRTPGGFNLLVDGGPDEAITLATVDGLLPMADRDIDVAVLSHPDSDHFNGLMALAQRGRLRLVVVPPMVDSADDLWRRALESTGVNLVEGRPGLTLDLPDGVRLTVLYSPSPPLGGTGADVNNNGLVVMVSFDHVSVLFTGDLEAVGELVLLAGGADLSAHVLKLAHHGSDTSSTEKFLQAVAPAVVIILVGEDNRFDHPSPEVLARVRETLPGVLLYAKPADGTIELTTDGERWWAKTQR